MAGLQVGSGAPPIRGHLAPEYVDHLIAQPVEAGLSAALQPCCRRPIAFIACGGRADRYLSETFHRLGSHVRQTGVPTAVRRLIAERIESVHQLEILLLLRAARDKSWSPREVARALVTGVETSEDWLQRMAHDGFLVRDRDKYRYAPATAELDHGVDGLAESYAKYRVAVVTLIFSKPSERVRTFSDAFRIRRRRE